jgi:hypothetical protein
VAGLLLATSVSAALAQAPRKREFRSPGKPQAPVRVTISTTVASPGIGQAIPIVVEAAPTIDTESLYLHVRLPEGIQMLTGRNSRDPEYVPAGETRRLEFEVITLHPGTFVIPVFASVRVGQYDQVGISAMKILTQGTSPTPEPMLRQRMINQVGYDQRYKTVVGKVIE